MREETAQEGPQVLSAGRRMQVERSEPGIWSGLAGRRAESSFRIARQDSGWGTGLILPASLQFERSGMREHAARRNANEKTGEHSLVPFPKAPFLTPRSY